MEYIGNLQHPNEQKRNFKKYERMQKKFSLWVVTNFLGKLLKRVFWCSIILVTVAHFVPELREHMPLLYKLIDDVVFKVVNWLCSLLTKFI